MSTAAARKVLVATGCSSALGFHAIKQLLSNPTTPPYKAILGCRDPAAAQKAYDATKYDSSKHELVLLPLELADFSNVKSFAEQAKAKLDGSKIDILFLNAGLTKGPGSKNPHPFRNFNETATVNHFAQHYLVQLLREDLQKGGRIVFVSSGAIRMIKSLDELEPALRDNTDADQMKTYAASKFAQLLNAIWWRKQLQGKTSVVAVSPGLIPGTGLGRHAGMQIPSNLPDAKSIDEGASNLLRAFHQEGQPEDEHAVYLASWSEWWDLKKEVPLAVGTDELQAEYSPSQQDIERDAKL